MIFYLYTDAKNVGRFFSSRDEKPTNNKRGAFISGIENENSDPCLCRVFPIILLSFRKLLWITIC